MPLESWLLYVGTVLALMITSGSSQLLALSNSASTGIKRSLATACGDLTAHLLQMLAAGFGLALNPLMLFRKMIANDTHRQ